MYICTALEHQHRWIPPGSGVNGIDIFSLCYLNTLWEWTNGQAQGTYPLITESRGATLGGEGQDKAFSRVTRPIFGHITSQVLDPIQLACSNAAMPTRCACHPEVGEGQSQRPPPRKEGFVPIPCGCIGTWNLDRIGTSVMKKQHSLQPSPTFVYSGGLKKSHKSNGSQWDQA